MENNYILYPSTIKALAEEIKRACNDYNARRINNDEIKEVINWYAENQADKLFAAEEINPTISKIIGKKRVNLINILLESPQKHGGK